MESKNFKNLTLLPITDLEYEGRGNKYHGTY